LGELCLGSVITSGALITLWHGATSMRSLLNRRRRDTAVRLLLALFLFRPTFRWLHAASGTPFLLQICPVESSIHACASHAPRHGKHTISKTARLAALPARTRSQFIAFQLHIPSHLAAGCAGILSTGLSFNGPPARALLLSLELIYR